VQRDVLVLRFIQRQIQRQRPMIIIYAHGTSFLRGTIAGIPVTKTSTVIFTRRAVVLNICSMPMYLYTVIGYFYFMQIVIQLGG